MNKSSLVKVAVAAGAAGAAGAVVAAGRRWAANDDPDAATRLEVPDGEDARIPTLDGGEIAATVAGDGRTFVLVHGWTNDRRIWAPVARLLVERGHRVVLYDQRGHGASRPGRDGLTIEALGSDMAAVLEHLDIRDAVVAGHSMGGMAAQAFAIEHPDVLSKRVAAVALVSTACSDLAMPGPANRLAPLVLGSRLASRSVSSSRLGPFLVRRTMGRKATLSNLKAMQDTFAATKPSARAGFYRAMAAMDLSEGLADVDVPVVVISGTRDALVPHANARRLTEIINGAHFEALPDAGHMLPLERPDQVADLLERLAEQSSEHDRSLSAAAR
ncbi:MAG: alpha/beta fold hydrolase [Acidimicrobiia bacterium]|nr:alpha/beta fold hydrolase [Acidimicrobiia bacterium]